MQTDYQHIIKNKTDKQLERIAKGSTSHSAEERLFVIEQLEKRGIEWEETPLSPSLATLKRNLEKSIKEAKQDKKKVAAKKQEEWTGEPMTFWEGVRDMTLRKVLRVLYYQGFLLTKRLNFGTSNDGWNSRGAHGFLLMWSLLPFFFIILLGRYVFGVDFESESESVVSYIVIVVLVIAVCVLLHFLLGSEKKIIEEKPTVFNNHRYSGYFFAVVMGVPFLVTILLLFYLA